MQESLGVRIQPILLELELTVNESVGTKPNYPEESLKAATSIFMSVLMDKIFEKQVLDKIELSNACDMATECGNELRQLIKKYTGKDSFDFYK
jgi:hypothetical protein